ncbi:MAG TPA: hypothetical protein VNV38_12185 [Stellaceae bacterium]|jgi:hypothetical protein|nr:hypothetical protein [Stellaceae bacterium]
MTDSRGPAPLLFDDDDFRDGRRGLFESADQPLPNGAGRGLMPNFGVWLRRPAWSSDEFLALMFAPELLAVAARRSLRARGAPGRALNELIKTHLSFGTTRRHPSNLHITGPKTAALASTIEARRQYVATQRPSHVAKDVARAIEIGQVKDPAPPRVWLDFAEACGWPIPAVLTASKRRGPAPGSVSRYSESDRELHAEIRAAMAKGSRSLSAVCQQLADEGKVQGGGTASSLARRLRESFKKAEEIRSN